MLEERKAYFEHECVYYYCVRVCACVSVYVRVYVCRRAANSM
jgi:hypothetical protein